LLDIDRVVVGGPIAAAGSALWKPLQNAVAMHARLPFLSGLCVVSSELADLGLLAGAGVIALTSQNACSAHRAVVFGGRRRSPPRAAWLLGGRVRTIHRGPDSVVLISGSVSLPVRVAGW